jgi:hypothetical protein
MQAQGQAHPMLHMLRAQAAKILFIIILPHTEPPSPFSPAPSFSCAACVLVVWGGLFFLCCRVHFTDK